MKHPDAVTVDLVSWTEKESELYAVRKAVFIDEQHVPADIEMDEHDPHCQHVLAVTPDHQPVGTGRIDPRGKIGRMAVLASYRGRGIGEAILNTLIRYGKDNGLDHVRLSAQLHAVGFYEKYGFMAYGDTFPEAGIEHVMMKRDLSISP